MYRMDGRFLILLVQAYRDEIFTGWHLWLHLKKHSKKCKKPRVIEAFCILMVGIEGLEPSTSSM